MRHGTLYPVTAFSEQTRAKRIRDFLKMLRLRHDTHTMPWASEASLVQPIGLCFSELRKRVETKAIRERWDQKALSEVFPTTRSKSWKIYGIFEQSDIFHIDRYLK